MHCSGPLPLIFEGPEQRFGGKNCQMGVRKINGSQGNLAFLSGVPVMYSIFFRAVRQIMNRQLQL